MSKFLTKRDVYFKNKTINKIEKSKLLLPVVDGVVPAGAKLFDNVTRLQSTPVVSALTLTASAAIAALGTIPELMFAPSAAVALLFGLSIHMVAKRKHVMNNVIAHYSAEVADWVFSSTGTVLTENDLNDLTHIIFRNGVDRSFVFTGVDGVKFQVVYLMNDKPYWSLIVLKSDTSKQTNPQISFSEQHNELFESFMNLSSVSLKSTLNKIEVLRKQNLTVEHSYQVDRVASNLAEAVKVTNSLKELDDPEYLNDFEQVLESLNKELDAILDFEREIVRTHLKSFIQETETRSEQKMLGSSENE